ncbi:Sulfate permease [hydrothermal vent metagenome]|uniref:Sulfate permease n=1 Tax=hydrothermal vent metagenome TaxID=652676 RepID=A0A3B1BFF5_9ZZZZ
MRNKRTITTLLPFLAWLPCVDRGAVKADFLAGLTNAIVALPQGVAFAMIAGLPPVYGLYTAIIPPIIAGLFGSSFHMISGPTTALSIVIFSTISPYAHPGSAEFVSLALTLTFLAGLIQFGLGLARMGALVNFISHSVIVGFTAGAAILIATSQIKNVLGISVPSGASFLHTWIDVGKNIGATNPAVLTTAIVTLLTVVLLKRYRPKWPGMLLATFAGGLVAAILGAEAHGIKLLGPLPASLPPLSMPDFSAVSIREMTSGALAIAMLGLIAAVAIARSIATTSRQRIDGNQEFIGQGLANIVGSFFSCYAASGSFTRSGLNYTSGAKTPLSAVFSAISLAIILLVVAPLTAYLPIPAMGGIVLLVAYNLVDVHHIRMILKTSPAEAAVLSVTFFSTLFVELEFAIYVGIILSLILYLNQTSKPSIVSRVPHPTDKGRSFYTDPDFPECPQLKIIRIDGSIYFGSVDHVEEVLQRIDEEDPGQVNVLILCSGINFIDVTGAEALAHEAKRRREKGGGLFLYGVKDAVIRILRRGGYLARIGRENIFCSKDEAIRSITEQLNKSICTRCGERIFVECDNFPKDDDVVVETFHLKAPEDPQADDFICGSRQ